MRTPLARTYFDALREAAEHAPDQAAVITEDGTTSYAQLLTGARLCAAGLRARGVQRGTRIGLLLDNGVAFLEVFLGAHALGAVVVPFSTWSTRDELAFLVEDSCVRLLCLVKRPGGPDLVTHLAAPDGREGGDGSDPDEARVDGSRVEGSGAEGPVADGRPPVITVIFDEGGASTPLHPVPGDETRPLTEDLDLPPGGGASAADTAVILYTSGSSSRPKAVPLQHFAAIENGFNIGERQGLRAGDRVFVPVPLFWSYGCVNALPAVLSHSATLVLQRRFETDRALDLIEQHACTALYTLPAITNTLLSAPSFAPARTASLRTGVTIGSAQDVIRAATELGANEICNIYGSTETYGNASVTWHHWPLQRRAHCQGLPLPGVSVRIVTPGTDACIASGEVGEVLVHGYLTPGYLGHSARFNATAFTADGWFRTGDLATLDEDGALVYAGRLTEMIKRSGINVSPAEVEATLQRHPDVALAGVTGVADRVLGERIVAFVVARSQRSPTASALLAHCRAHLSSYKLPDRIELTDTLPLTATGKLMRRALREAAADLPEPDWLGQMH